MSFMNILILNGPNLNLLGKREPEIYGQGTYSDLVRFLEEYCRSKGIGVEIRQSNHEGVLIDAIQAAAEKFDGIIINPAAYTHTSIALLDALKAVNLPTVEVHLSDPDLREDFRKTSYIRSACLATIKGQGFNSYTEAVNLLSEVVAAS